MKRIGRIGLIGLVGIVLAGCICLPAMGQDVPGGSAAAFTNVPAADVPAAAVKAAQEATPFIADLARKYSAVMMVLSLIGLLRVICKPIVTFLEAVTKFGPGDHNPIWLQRCQKSMTVRWAIWLFDWLGSIKPPSIGTTNPSLNGAGNGRSGTIVAMAAGLFVLAVGCAGCSLLSNPVPRNKVDVQVPILGTNGQPVATAKFHGEFHKDVNLGGASVTYTPGNGFMFTVTNLASTNNPQTIGTAYTAQGMDQKAMWDGINALVPNLTTNLGTATGNGAAAFLKK